MSEPRIHAGPGTLSVILGIPDEAVIHPRQERTTILSLSEGLPQPRARRRFLEAVATFSANARQNWQPENTLVNVLSAVSLEHWQRCSMELNHIFYRFHRLDLQTERDIRAREMLIGFCGRIPLPDEYIQKEEDQLIARVQPEPQKPSVKSSRTLAFRQTLRS